MKAIIACLILCALVSAEQLEGIKKPVRVIKKNFREEFGLMKVVVVPKGDPRARGPIPQGCPKCKCECPKQQNPFVPTVPKQNPLVPAVPKLQSGAPCRDDNGRAGTCIDVATCRGTSVSGKCRGANNIKCCIPAATPVTPTPTPVTPTPAPAGTCAYATGPTERVAGNGGVVYTAALIRREHLSDASDYGVAMTQADNRIVVSTGTACAFEKLVAAAKAAGVTITINSGFRTLSRQQYFYNCMVTKKCNGGRLAAQPGSSNHGQGLALDLNTACGEQGTKRAPAAKPPAACRSSPVYMFMLNNGAQFGFVRTVQNEPWHYEYRPGRAVPAWQKF